MVNQFSSHVRSSHYPLIPRFQFYCPGFCKLILNVVTKHANDFDLFAPNWIIKVYPLFTYDVSYVRCILKCFNIIHQPSRNPTKVDTPRIISGKDLYSQMIVICLKGNETFKSDDTFHVCFLNIFIHYPLGQM